MFHIGVMIPKLKRRKSNLKKKTILKKLCLVKPTLKPFEPYTGPRWQLPSGLHVSEQTIYTFQSFDTIPAAEVFKSIKTRQNQISFSNLFFNTPVQDWDNICHSYTWKPPATVTAMIQRHRINQETILKRVKNIYIDLYHFTKQIKKLVLCHRIYKSLVNVKNVTDPVTLDAPLKPVYVLDYLNRLSYVYEASTLRKTIENRILFSDYMFPEPKPPVNLLSNKPFTRGQLFSIIDACRAHGEFSWVLDRFKKCECRLNIFQYQFKQDLKIEAIHFYFKNQKEYAKDTVIDYFESYVNNLGVDDRVVDSFINIYTRLIQKKRPHSYIQQWINLTKRYYIAAELRELVELSLISIDSAKLCRQAEKVFAI